MSSKIFARSKYRVGLGAISLKIKSFISVQMTHQIAERREREKSLSLASPRSISFRPEVPHIIRGIRQGLYAVYAQQNEANKDT